MQNAFGFNPFQQFESMGKQNMAMFENSMRLLNPFAAGQGGAPGAAPAHTNGGEAPKAEAAAPSEEAIDDLKRKLDELQSQLSQFGKKS